MAYRQDFWEVHGSTEKQDALAELITQEVRSQKYDSVVLFCGNFLLFEHGGKAHPWIPETYDFGGEITDPELFEACKNMDALHFDTKFSYFSLKMGLNVFQRLETQQKQLLLSIDDKYVDGNLAQEYSRKGYYSIPSIYKKELAKQFWNEREIRKHLSQGISALNTTGLQNRNEYALSERTIVNRFHSTRTRDSSYSEYQESLWKAVTSCSLEIFHLLKIIDQAKAAFSGGIANQKTCVIIFVPDACFSSAMNWGLAVSKTSADFEIINITQQVWGEDGILMLNRVSLGWVEKI